MCLLNNSLLTCNLLEVHRAVFADARIIKRILNENEGREAHLQEDFCVYVRFCMYLLQQEIKSKFAAVCTVS